jgi:catechol 2,3-dioxygenase-like lactoylglutathione lyase family enzyme
MPVSRIHHVGITVSDMERSLAFYRDLLGLRVLADTRLTRPEIATLLGTDEIDLRVVDLDTKDGRILELLQYSAPRGRHVDYTSRDAGSGHVAFAVDDLDRIREGIDATGGSVISRDVVAAADTEGLFARARLLYVRDPDGMILELVELP